MLSLDKYIWKKRIIIIQTPNLENTKYISSIKEYNIYKNEFKIRLTKVLIYRKKDLDFEIKLIGLDGEVKKKYKNFNSKQIIADIDAMPMGHLRA